MQLLRTGGPSRSLLLCLGCGDGRGRAGERCKVGEEAQGTYATATTMQGEAEIQGAYASETVGQQKGKTAGQDKEKTGNQVSYTTEKTAEGEVSLLEERKRIKVEVKKKN